MRRIVFLLLFSAFTLIIAQNQIIQNEESLQIMPDTPVFNDQIKFDTYHQVCQLVDSLYYDPTFNGKDWRQITASYQNQINNCKTSDSLNALLHQMVNEIGKSHLGIFSMDQITTLFMGPPVKNKKGVMGIQFNCLEGKIIVTGFSEDYLPKYGIHIGDELIAVDGKDVQKLYHDFEIKNKCLINDKNRISALNLAGNIGQKRVLSFITPTNKSYKTKIKYVQNHSASQVFTCKMIGDYAYLKLKLFNLDYHDKLREAFPELKKAKGWIIDLRNNPGGGENLEGSFLQYLCRDSISLGSQVYRNEEISEKIKGREDAFEGMVTVIINENSGSASEVLAACLQERKRAVIIGKKSAGRVLSSTMILLPNNAQLQIANGNYLTPNRNTLEGIGVVPDIEADTTLKSYQQGEDPFISKAMEILKRI